MFTKISLTFFAASAGLLLSSSSSAVEASSFNVRGSRERGDHGLQESAPDDNRLIILDSNDEENGKELEPQKHGRDLLTLSGDEVSTRVLYYYALLPLTIMVAIHRKNPASTHPSMLYPLMYICFYFLLNFLFFRVDCLYPS